METPYVAKDRESITTALENLIGKTVCVSWVSDRTQLRNCFEPQISVQAKLEGSFDGGFRVLVNNDTYSYFYYDSVWSVGQDEGKRAIIFIDA
tara:strand:+ start:131 stop:409 length:279 start_codon:yes stop_codon:yes gene_type:complete